jgi:hypothetical protein
MTPLRKKVIRRSEETYRDGSRHRRIIVTLYPSGIIGLRLEKTHRCREETLSLQLAFETAIRSRVAFEHAQKAKRKGGAA